MCVLSAATGLVNGARYYVFDAWNRVAAAYQPGTLTVEAGVLTGEPGECVARYEYDALGRRLRSTHLWSVGSVGIPGVAFGAVFFVV